jgi:hypothetical protein
VEIIETKDFEKSEKPVSRSDIMSHQKNKLEK